MGWWYEYKWTTRKSIVADLTKRENTKQYAIEKNNSIYADFNCLRHCYRGNIYSGVLWAVWEVTTKNVDNDNIVEIKRHISCDLVKYSNHEGIGMFGHKPMDESMGPYYYSCPLSYLEMTPVANQEWRDSVIEYHNKRRKISQH